MSKLGSADYTQMNDIVAKPISNRISKPNMDLEITPKNLVAKKREMEIVEIHNEIK
jgi:hypothetical protein